MSWRDRSPAFRISTVLVPLSLLLYLGSLALHVAETRTTISMLGVGRTTTSGYKLLSVIRDLFENGDLILAIMITSFTIVFPISKYVGLAYVMRTSSVRRRGRVLNWIKNWGQWSMGDVFVVALLVVILRINTGPTSMEVVVLPGLYVFASSVILSMVASVLLAIDEQGRVRQSHPVAATVASDSVAADSPARSADRAPGRAPDALGEQIGGSGG